MSRDIREDVGGGVTIVPANEASWEDLQAARLCRGMPVPALQDRPRRLDPGSPL